MTTYIQRATALLREELPDLDPGLEPLYLLLLLTAGDAVSRAQVHDAWAIWRDQTDPQHRSIIPYAELSREVQSLDEPYVSGIRQAARRLEADTRNIAPRASRAPLQ